MLNDVDVTHTIWMVGVSHALDMSLESSFVIRAVVNNTVGAIGFIKGVLPLHDVSISVFPSSFMIVAVIILDTIFEFIHGMTVIIFVGRNRNGQTNKQSNKLENMME